MRGPVGGVRFRGQRSQVRRSAVTGQLSERCQTSFAVISRNNGGRLRRIQAMIARSGLHERKSNRR